MSSRIHHPGLRSKVMSAAEAAAFIQHGTTVGMSGFTGSGYPKAVPTALAERAKDVRVTTRLVDSPACLVTEEGDMSAHLARLLKQTFAPLCIPVLAGWRSGHCDPNLTLPMGALVRLDAGEQRVVLEQDVVFKA